MCGGEGGGAWKRVRVWKGEGRTVMTYRAPREPASTVYLGCLMAIRAAMMNVSSPNSHTRICHATMVGTGFRRKCPSLCHVGDPVWSTVMVHS